MKGQPAKTWAITNVLAKESWNFQFFTLMENNENTKANPPLETVLEVDEAPATWTDSLWVLKGNILNYLL